MRQYCSDMELLKDVNNKIAESKTEMLASLSNLISIPSVAIEAGGSKPFGDKVQEAFEYMLKLAEDEGFEVYNADNFGGHIDFKGTEDGIVGIVGHLDVVPEGDGWDFEPYGGVISDGKLYGRGAIDDKGPVMASLVLLNTNILKCLVRILTNAQKRSYQKNTVWNGWRGWILTIR